MKKSLLTLIFLVTAIFVNAQCTPDPSFSSPGIYPDSSTGLANAYVGQAYSEVITVISPLDTVVEFNGAMLPVTIETIELTSLTGLPSNFTYSCLAANCIFLGGSASCALLSSTSDPTSNDIGSYQLILNTTTTVDAGIGFPITQEDVVDYYYLNILETTSTLNQFDNTTFDLKSVYLNPIFNQAKVQFVTGVPESVIFKVYNLLGEEIDSRLISSVRGVNTILLNTSSYSEGIYLYSINNGSQILTKRMLLKN